MGFVVVQPFEAETVLYPGLKLAVNQELDDWYLT
jgi:hypothetical protein